MVAVFLLPGEPQQAAVCMEKHFKMEVRLLFGAADAAGSCEEEQGAATGVFGCGTDGGNGEKRFIC